MKILVCGSEGSLMQAVIPKLLEKGYVVYGADNLMRYGERLGLAGTDYEFFKVDLTDRMSVDLLVRSVKPDYIIQAAARIYGVRGFNRYCADILGEDLTLHNNVLKAANAHSVKKVIYISSSMVYESVTQHVDYHVLEDMPDWHKCPLTEYGLSKFVGERMSIAFEKQYELPYTIWRPFNIITPYERSDENMIGISHVFSDFIKNIVVDKKNPLPILGSGDQIRCFTWIDEVANAIADHSFYSLTDNEVYNLGNPEPISMKDLAIMIHHIASSEFGVKLEELKFQHLGAFKNDVMVRIPNVDKVERELGWKAEVKVSESIRRCIKKALETE
jgi:nucleoside-diphosphate-sugar epimerase